MISRLRTCARALASLAAASLVAPSAWAQAPVDITAPMAPEPVATTGSKAPALVLALETQVLATDNANLSGTGARRDLVLSLRPSMAYRHLGRNLDVDVEGGLTLRSYARDSGGQGVMPDARARARATLLDRWLSLEGAAAVQPVQSDPYAAPVSGSLGTQTRTQKSLRLSPVLDHAFTTRNSLLLRHDAAVSSHPTLDDARLNSHQTTARLSYKPQRLGGTLEWTRHESDTNGEDLSRLLLQRWQLHGMAEVIDDWVLGAFVGREDSRLLLEDHSDRIYGLSLRWVPSQRTELDGRIEQRFFGKAGSLSLKHRMPMMSIALHVAREPQTSIASLGVLAQGADLRAHLDGILTTRVPDAGERRATVDSLVQDRGLSTRLAQPFDLQAAYPQLASTASVMGVVHGTRNTASISAYRQTLVALTREDQAFNIPATTDSRQTGFGLQWDHRLTPQLDSEVALRWTRVDGLGLRLGETSDAKSLRLSLSQQLGPRTQASGGLQFLRVDAVGGGRSPYDATSLFLGLRHRL